MCDWTQYAHFKSVQFRSYEILLCKFPATQICVSNQPEGKPSCPTLRSQVLLDFPGNQPGQHCCWQQGLAQHKGYGSQNINKYLAFRSDLPNHLLTSMFQVRVAEVLDMSQVWGLAPQLHQPQQNKLNCLIAQVKCQQGFLRRGGDLHRATRREKKPKVVPLPFITWQWGRVES